MRVAVTDANVFIDLWELGWLQQISALGLEIHTTNLVFAELNERQRGIVNSLFETGHHFLHSLTDEQVFSLSEMDFSRGLSDADKSVLWLVGQNLFDLPLVLSGDKLLRNWCLKNGVEVHGILWIFDQMLTAGLTTPSEACMKLLELMRSNQWLPQKECWERLERWKGGFI